MSYREKHSCDRMQTKAINQAKFKSKDNLVISNVSEHNHVVQDEMRGDSNYGRSRSRYLIYKFLKYHKYTIGYNGKLFKLLKLEDYNTRLFQLVGLIIVGFMAHIIKKYTFHPVTVIGNTIYSRVISSCMSKYNIPHILCKSNNRLTYYIDENGNEIPFEGPNPQVFSEYHARLIPIIPHSYDELIKLESHTQLKNLNVIQEKILADFPIKDGINVYDIVRDDEKIANPVIKIKRFLGNLYYVKTTNEIWLTRLIISDNVSPLQPDEIISCLYGSSKCESNNIYNIIHDNIECVIREPKVTTSLSRRSGYRICDDFTIKSEYTTDDDECIFYSLEQPRTFIKGPMSIIHPFHLPITWDPFLTIMIVTLGLIEQQKI